MTDRLQGIKNRYRNNAHAYYGELIYKGIGKIVFEDKEDAKDDVGWLISEVERFQEKTERYEKALEFYADKANYIRKEEDIITGYPPEVMNDRGWEARQALEGGNAE